MAKKKTPLTPAQALGRAIREQRLFMDIRTVDLAATLGVLPNAICKYERGQRLTCQNVQRIADAIAISPSQLVALAEDICRREKG
jgi:predicted transcriptional regulator